MLFVLPLGALMAATWEDILVGPLDMVMDVLLTDPLDVMVIPFQ